MVGMSGEKKRVLKCLTIIMQMVLCCSLLQSMARIGCAIVTAPSVATYSIHHRQPYLLLESEDTTMDPSAESGMPSSSKSIKFHRVSKV